MVFLYTHIFSLCYLKLNCDCILVMGGESLCFCYGKSLLKILNHKVVQKQVITICNIVCVTRIFVGLNKFKYDKIVIVIGQ